MDLRLIVNNFVPQPDEWDIEEVELSEGSAYYNMRLEVVPSDSFNEALLVSDTLVNFRSLFTWLVSNYSYDRMRVYFQQRDTYEITRVNVGGIPTGTLRLNRATVMQQQIRNQAQIDAFATAVYNQLLAMSEYYSDELLGGFVIIIDLHVNEQFGACGNGAFPAYFPAEFNRDTLYNPAGGNCFLKCVYRHFVGDAPANDAVCFDYARARNIPLDTETMLHDRLADAVCAATNVRVVIVDCMLNVKYYVGTFDETMVLMLSGRHYYYVYDLGTLVKSRWGENCYICFRCGQAVGHTDHPCRGQQVPQQARRHECVNYSQECGKCNKVFTSKQQKHYHMKESRSCRNERCEGCGMSKFFSQACYNYHVKNCKAYEAARGKNIHCAGCGKRYYAGRGTHECFFPRLLMPEEVKYPDGIYVFDFESMFSEADERGARAHTVNYVVVKKLFDDDFMRHMRTLEEFVDWLNCMSDCKALILAHNFRGYDGRLLLAELLRTDKEDRTVENFVTVGTKLNSFRWGSLQFADSLLHIAQPLDQFPKIFGLADIECKGFFPYEFNVAENQNYRGPIPAVEVFRPEKMSEKRRDAFLRWHAEWATSDEPYNFNNEMVKYCELDVEIMKRGLEVYITSAQSACEGLNPLDSFTVASAAYRIWRTLHMPENVLSYYGPSFHENARCALRGGRTDVRCLYRAWTPEQVFVEKRYGVYADVQSMYPHIQMTKPLPVGHPVRLDTPKREDFAGKLGIMKCSLVPPPTFQFHPAICVRDDESGRLVAPLHRGKLANIFITTTEFEQAMRQGYTVSSIKFVDVYKESTELFKSYIRTFLKIKVEKSQDYPGDVKFRQLYDMYRERCGIELEAANFENNPGLKQIAKLYLNSLWGKLCERAKFERTEHLDWASFIDREEQEEMGFFEPSLKLRFGNKWLVRGVNKTFNRENDERENRKKTSPAIGAFITMYGRTMLLEQMERLGKRALYHDTDSIVYERQEGAYNIPLGKCLGDWEDELKGRPMIEFVALAPKSYSYRYLDEPVPDYSAGPYWEWEGQRYPVREVTKIKGVRQCFETSTIIDFDAMKALVDKTRNKITTEQVLFSFNIREMTMSTRDIEKDTSFCYGKGIVGTDYHTYPPGTDQYAGGEGTSWEHGAPLVVTASGAATTSQDFQSLQ